MGYRLHQIYRSFWKNQRRYLKTKSNRYNPHRFNPPPAQPPPSECWTVLQQNFGSQAGCHNARHTQASAQVQHALPWCFCGVRNCSRFGDEGAGYADNRFFIIIWRSSKCECEFLAIILMLVTYQLLHVSDLERCKAAIDTYSNHTFINIFLFFI